MAQIRYTLRTYLRYTSWPIILAMLALMVLGVLGVRVYERSGSTAGGLAARQAVLGAVGVLAFIAATALPYQRLGRYAYVLFGLTLVVLVLLLALPHLYGSSPVVKRIMPGIRSTHRWINLGFIKLQPSEIAKLTFIILLAWYLRYGNHYRRLRGLIVPFVLTLVPMVLILKQPDLGTSLLFLPTLYFMLFMAGAKLRHLLGIIVAATLLLLIPVPRRVTAQMRRGELADRKAWAYGVFVSGNDEYIVSAAPLALMEAHQLRRIDGWIRQGDPEVAGGRGYQLRQSKMILAIGALAGGQKWNEQNQFFRTLPDGHTDFIFSIVGGQWGLLGCALVLLFYAVIFIFGTEIAVITYDPFGRLLAVGVLGLLLSQILINVGMTMGLTPITGMTLPLVSHGGSSLVINCLALGLLVNIGQRRPVLLAPRPFEHREKKEHSAAYGPMRHGRAEK